MFPAIPSEHGVPTPRSSHPDALVTARAVRVIGWAAVAAFVLGRPAWALPSPDVVVNLFASAAQVLGLLTVVLGKWFGTLAYMRRPYPTDLSDAEWSYIEPHLPVPKGRGRPRTHSLREIINAIFYVLKSGCQ